MRISNYSEIKVVGIVEGQLNSRHCIIHALGYLDESWKFIPLTKSELLTCFPSRGCVFAPNFKDRYSKLEGKCVYVGLMRSNNDGRDEYVWNRDAGIPDEYGTTVLNGKIGSIERCNPEKSYRTFEALGFLKSLGGKSFYKTENILFEFDSDISKKLWLTAYDFDKIQHSCPDAFATYDDVHYAYIKGEIKAPKCYVDIMPDEKLQDWFVKHFFTKEWQTFRSASSLDGFISSLLPLMKKSNIPEEIIHIRVERIRLFLSSIDFSVSQLNEIALWPELKEAVDASIQHHCTEYIDARKSQYAIELKKVQDEYNRQLQETKDATEKEISGVVEKIANEKAEKENEISVLANLISSKKEELANIEAQISEQQNLLSLIEGKRGQLAEDFSVVKEIISIVTENDNRQSKHTNEILYIEDGDAVVNNPLTIIPQIEHYLRSNNRNPEIAKKILGLLSFYKVVVFPDVRLASIVVQATGQCKYIVRSINPEVRDFSIIWEAGLQDLVVSCLANPKMMHYCVLQNINMSYLPCYFQPVIDLLIGLRRFFPGTQLELPNNLRFILTTTKEKALPLSEQSLRLFGCLENKDYTIDKESEFSKTGDSIESGGCLTTNTLMEFKELCYGNVIPTEYKSYIEPEDE